MFHQIVEYIWLDAKNYFRSKTRVFYTSELLSLNDIPIWNFDGSSTGQATTENSECYLKPVWMCNNPFVKSGYLVLCAVYQDPSCVQPHITNYYKECHEIMNLNTEKHFQFGFEQEYFILQRDGTNMKPCIPNLTDMKDSNPQGQYYCSIGAENSFCRRISQRHLDMCLEAGLKMWGTNAEVAPAQWEYQIGPIEGIEACHQLWMSRYILIRVAEELDLCILFHPKPFLDLNGSGCHTNISTQDTRGNNGIQTIESMMTQLELTHKLDIEHYGEDNEARLTGTHETSNICQFTWGYGTRNTSVRISRECQQRGSGYFEDRRPAANMDPYRVCKCIVKSIFVRSAMRHP